MKSRVNPLVRLSKLLAVSAAASPICVHATDYTVGVGDTLNLSNGGYTAANLLLQGGTVSGSGNYNAYGASVITGVTVSGSAASTVNGSSWFNIVSPTTFTVADVTGDASTDLNINISLRPLPGSPDYTYSSASIIKEGAGTMEMTVHSYIWGATTLNGGTLKVSGGNGGYGHFSGAVNVNAGTTLTINSDGTGFGYQNGWRPTSVNINGGTVNGGGNHVWGISGGVNMTGGTLQVDSGSFQWNYTNLNTNASADTATIAGPLNLRGDGGYSGLSANVADGSAATDLLISGNVTELYGALGISKSGAGTMELSGTNSYTGATTVSAGKLIVSGNISTSITTIQAGGTLAGSGTVGAVTIQDNGALAPGNSPGTLTFTGDLTLASGSISNFEINSFSLGNYDLALAAAAGTQNVSFDGVLNLLFTTGFNTIGSIKIFDFDGYSGAFTTIVPTGLASGYTATFDNATGVVSVVPEPASLLLGALGAIGLLRRRRG